MGDKVLLFNEDTKFDNQFRRLLYNDRIKTRKEILLLYDQVKKDFPFIKYTFPSLKQYQMKNVFVDCYYYNNIFFKNNSWVLNKGLNLYLDFMQRMVNNPLLSNNGYEKKTIFIPILDWNNKDTEIWNYRQSINPMSCIYQLMYTDSRNKLLNTFGDINIIFIGTNKYFKLNFKELIDSDINFKRSSLKFKTFLTKIIKNEEFDLSDIDTTVENNETPKVIRTKLADKIELSKGVDLTPQLADIDDLKKKNNSIFANPDNIKSTEEKNKDDISKATLNKDDKGKINKKEIDIKNLANKIDIASSDSKSEEDALDKLDYTDKIKEILIDLDSYSDNKVDITAGRALRINKLDRKLLSTKLKIYYPRIVIKKFKQLN